MRSYTVVSLIWVLDIECPLWDKTTKVMTCIMRKVWHVCEHCVHDSSITFMALYICVCITAFSEAIFYIFSKPCQDWSFWRVLICILNIPNAGHFVNFWCMYINYFYFHCHDKRSVIFFPLQIVFMGKKKNEPFYFLPFV